MSTTGNLGDGRGMSRTKANRYGGSSLPNGIFTARLTNQGKRALSGRDGKPSGRAWRQSVKKRLIAKNSGYATKHFAKLLAFFEFRRITFTSVLNLVFSFQNNIAIFNTSTHKRHDIRLSTWY